MLRKLTLICGALLALSAAQVAKADVCDSLASIEDGKSELRVKNCKQALKEIPNKEGINYTMQYFKDNYRKLADPTCAAGSSSVKRGVLSRAKVENGIQNGCQFVFNDLKRPYGGLSSRSTAYFIDLCAADPKGAVKTIYMNRGTGSARKGYTDVNGQKTTLAGAFLTNDQVYSFHPFKMKASYVKIKKQLGGKIPGLRLVGLNSSNNDSEYGKPLHASPYRSSSGCPSVGPENAWVLSKLASNGPSLLMNYGPSTMHQSTKSCSNQTAKASRSSSHSGSGSKSSSKGGSK